MTEKGSVVEIRENLVIVAPDKSAACFGCMNMECKSGGGLITAENPKALPLGGGQMVEVEIPDVSIIKQALTAFLPPALAFTAGFIFIRLLFPKTGEGAAAFMGVILLFAAAFVVYRIRKSKPAENACTITKILPNSP